MFTPSQLFQIFHYYDDKRFIRVQNTHSYDVLCPHPAPIKQDTSAPESPTHWDTWVALDKYAFEGKDMGWAGKCEVCGRVYYR